MKSLTTLLLLTGLSAALAVTHNRAISRKQPSPVTQPVLAALAPGQRWVSEGRETLARLLKPSDQGSASPDETRRLAAEVERLQAHAQEVERENERLTRLLDLKSYLLIPSVAARVIGEGATASAQSATLDRGSRAGVRPRDVVVTDEGLVGQITGMIGPSSAVVLYLTDPSSGIGVRALRSGVLGVARGEGTPTLSLPYLDKGADVRKGDLIVTSGLGGVYPPGLYVGRVVDVQTDASGAGRTARILPAANLQRLEEALILKRS